VQFHPSLDPDGYAAAKQLWLGHTNEHPTNTAILGNAASFFVLADSEQAERLLLEAQKLEPKNPEWANRLGHLYALNRGSSEEETRTSALKSLEQYERSYQNAATREARFYGLSDLAKAAFEVGDLPKATQYANELVVMAADFPRDWNYGNAIHHGNLILGRVALRKGEVDRASDFLLKAGRTPGSPQLNSFGPNMALAKELLEKQQQKAVLEYFELCRKFWGMHADSLDRWKTDVEAGRTPDFGGNLVY
jgi:tetratricopeptide (TPR) repeat protein